MADSFKNSIRLGIELENASSVEAKLKTVIEELSKNKIKLSADDNVTKELEKLTSMAEKFKSEMGKNISFGDIDKTINSVTNAMTSLNEQILKTSEIRFNDGTGKQLKEMTEGIGVVKKQLTTLNENGEPNLVQTAPTIITNYTKIRQAIEDVANAQKQLNALESNGFTDINKISDLRNLLKDTNNIGSDSELKGYLNAVKELTSNESKIIEFSNQITKLKSNIVNLTDEKYSNVLDKGSFEQIANQLDKAQSELKNFNGSNLNGLKQQFTELNNVVSDFTTKTNNAQKLEQQSNKQLQEEVELLQKRNQAYQQISTLKSNGIISDSEINKLKELVQTASSLKEVNSALSSIGKVESRESSISSLTKQINDVQQAYEKLIQTFGNKLPDNFKSIDSELKTLKEDLNNIEGNNFNGIKNGLNNVKSEMTELKGVANSLKESSSGGFFSNIGDFLGKIGVFYGVQQVVQEIGQQFRNASEYIIQMDNNMSAMQMITGKTREEITQVTSQFKDLASQLHETNTNIMAGAEELMRAGYDDSTTKKMLEASTMASKISGQTNEATTSQLIAIKNAYGMTGDQMQHVIDTMSKLDNSSATSFKEISDAVMRTAFSANQAGTSFDTLSAYITTVSEKTRRNAESIGEAFKSIYSRYSNIKLGNVDEEGKSINDVETAMNRIGISIRSSKGEFKDFDVVLQEFVNKYKEGKLSQVDFMAGINTLGGTRFF